MGGMWLYQRATTNRLKDTVTAGIKKLFQKTYEKHLTNNFIYGII
jgi:hypothetical protein